MNKNLGVIDRLARVAIGSLLISLALLGPKVAWGWLGVIPLVTSILGWCPLYRLLGLSSRYVKS